MGPVHLGSRAPQGDHAWLQIGLRGARMTPGSASTSGRGHAQAGPQDLSGTLMRLGGGAPLPVSPALRLLGLWRHLKAFPAWPSLLSQLGLGSHRSCSLPDCTGLARYHLHSGSQHLLLRGPTARAHGSCCPTTCILCSGGDPPGASRGWRPPCLLCPHTRPLSPRPPQGSQAVRCRVWGQGAA